MIDSAVARLAAAERNMTRDRILARAAAEHQPPRIPIAVGVDVSEDDRPVPIDADRYRDE